MAEKALVSVFILPVSEHQVTYTKKQKHSELFKNLSSWNQLLCQFSQWLHEDKKKGLLICSQNIQAKSLAQKVFHQTGSNVEY